MLTKAQKKRKDRIKKKLVIIVKLSGIIVALILGYNFLKSGSEPEKNDFYILNGNYSDKKADDNGIDNEYVLNGNDSDYIKSDGEFILYSKSNDILNSDETGEKADTSSEDRYDSSKNESVLTDYHEDSHYDTEGKLNINQATKDELCKLNGIGEKRAESIIEYREENGGFGSILELMNISGIKNGVFGKIKDFVTTGN